MGGSWSVKQDENGLYTCRNCGDKFSAKQSRRRVYCSEECSDDYNTAGGPKQKTCEQCGETYKPHPITANRQRFCSDVCGEEWRTVQREQEYALISKDCEYCGDSYTPSKGKQDTQRWCSSKCRQKGQYEDRKAREAKGKANQVYTCRRCEKEFTALDTSRRVYCSEECATPYGSGPKVKTCEQCGEEYEPHPIAAWKQRFCGDECQRIWWLDNSDQRKDYNHTCSNCGKEFQTKRTDSVCCSQECTYEWIGKQNHENALINKRCFVCKTVFEGTQSGTDYCSKECRQRAYTNTCEQCGTQWVAPRAASICSEECRKDKAREDWQEYKRSIGRHQGRIEQLTCKHCGKQFEHEIYNQIPEYCSRRCSRLAWKKDNPRKVRISRRKQRHVRRARKYGNGRVDNIDPEKVFERDGWTCGICGRKVNPKNKFPHLASPSLDHIIPLARGGTHTWGNVQLAHLGCNSEKGDAPIGQLRLGITHEVTNGNRS